MINKKLVCVICKGKQLKLIKKIVEKPSVEVDYNIPPNQYLRHIYHCLDCGVYYNHHNLLDNNFYNNTYNKSIEDGIINKRFERIIKINSKNSDNKNRVKRIDNFCRGKLSKDKNVLDIGSGTCVFLYEMKKLGFKTYCIDPDHSAINHAEKVVKVNGAYHGNLLNIKINKRFELITFNKVLEHLVNPIEHLKKTRDYLKNNGILYIELPEGDRIIAKNKIENRSEFAIEHYTIYNNKSINNLLSESGFNMLQSEVITDPSGKYTIYAFANLM